MPVLRFQRKCLFLTKKTPAEKLRKVGSRSFWTIPHHGSAAVSTQDDSDDDRSDESIVNTALILFLEAVGTLVLAVKSEFTMKRITFKAVFKKASFKALTDGALWTRLHHRIQGIVEVKKARREGAKETQVKMQESGELVGLIINCGGVEALFNGHQLVISQDADQVFLSLAAIDDGYYHEYLVNGTQDSNPFLRVQTYGPWLLDDPDQMKQLCVVIASVVLLATGHR